MPKFSDAIQHFEEEMKNQGKEVPKKKKVTKAMLRWIGESPTPAEAEKRMSLLGIRHKNKTAPEMAALKAHERLLEPLNQVFNNLTGQLYRTWDEKKAKNWDSYVRGKLVEPLKNFALKPAFLIFPPEGPTPPNLAFLRQFASEFPGEPR